MRHLRDAAQPTPRTTTNDLAVTCNACLRSADADLAALIAAGYGDTPLRNLRFVCSGCGAPIRSRSSADRRMPAIDGLAGPSSAQAARVVSPCGCGRVPAMVLTCPAAHIPALLIRGCNPALWVP